MSSLRSDLFMARALLSEFGKGGLDEEEWC
jgi:hypothetical protein